MKSNRSLQSVKWSHWAIYSFEKSPQHILYTSHSAKWQKRETSIVTCVCKFDVRKVSALLYMSLLKGVWIHKQNQTKHTRSRSRGLCCLRSSFCLCYTHRSLMSVFTLLLMSLAQKLPPPYLNADFELELRGSGKTFFWMNLWMFETLLMSKPNPHGEQYQPQTDVTSGIPFLSERSWKNLC